MRGAILIMENTSRKKESASEALEKLKTGNQRFVNGESIHPNTGAEWIALAGRANQRDYAYATVISCSDSRVPVERIFDVGIMDVFVVRVAGNVLDHAEIGSVEFGISCVTTPLIVILGHTQCGAVTAVTHALHGREQDDAIHIPILVDNIQPAVERAMAKRPDVQGDAIIPHAIEENVWQGVHNLLTASPTTRRMAREGALKIVGAVYDIGTGQVDWLPEEKIDRIFSWVETNLERARSVMARDE